jgi:hypothetical protein
LEKEQEQRLMKSKGAKKQLFSIPVATAAVAPAMKKRRGPKEQLFSIPATAAYAAVTPATANGSQEKEEDCVVCGESFSSSMPGEVWVQCLFCLHWSHEACTDSAEHYICDLCDMN